jgi:hypothetical protein
MKNGKEILVFSIIACAILVLEFFYLPWGSINKTSSVSNIVKGVTFDGSISNAPSTSGSIVAQNFSSPMISPSHSFTGHSASGSGSYSKSSSIQSSTNTFGSSYSARSRSFSVSGSGVGSGSYGGSDGSGDGGSYGSSSSSSMQSSSSFGSNSLSSLNSLGQSTGENNQSGLSSQMFDGSQSSESSVMGDKMKKVSMTSPPPDDPLDADYLFLLFSIGFFLYKYLKSFNFKRSEQKKHVL